jgi:hypothetical protein
MPDITMCTGTDCPIKDDCYRYWAKSTKSIQSVIFPPYDETNKKCNEKWERKREPQSSRDSV